MRAHVPGQVGELREALPTARVVAGVIFPACVNALVHLQGVVPREARAAVSADIGRLSRVSTLVIGEVAAPPETRPAVFAYIWLFAGVNAIVRGQGGWVCESFATPWMVAGVLPFANGSPHPVRRRRWGHRRFCQSCRSYVRQQALLAVGGHCLQRGPGLHGLRDWRTWWGKRRIVGRLHAGVGNRAAVGRWELVLM